MKEILIKNQEILTRLNGFTDTFKKADESLIPIDFKRAHEGNQKYAVSDKYLEVMLRECKGPPAMLKGGDIGAWKGDPDRPTPKVWEDIHDDVTHDFTRELGAQQNALICYYPPGGFIGWHDNHDVPGYTLLFNWSEGGNGFYRYRDCETHEVVTIKDRPGWSCKTGYYGEGPLSTFHCAAAYEPRWSIAFYLRNKELRDDLIEEIQND
jgi:hypothetical protein